MNKEIKRFIDALLICLGFVVVMVVLVLLSGCCHQRPAPIEAKRDSTAIHIQYRLEWRKSLVDFTIPDIRSEVTTQDTTSFLENDFSESTASVSGGILTHSLNTKPRKMQVEADVPYERKDSTIYIYQDVVKIKEVEKPLTWWQETQIKGFWLMLIAIALFILWRKLKSKIGIF